MSKLGLISVLGACACFAQNAAEAESNSAPVPRAELVVNTSKVKRAQLVVKGRMVERAELVRLTGQ
jgi:hypothetical protein